MILLYNLECLLLMIHLYKVRNEFIEEEKKNHRFFNLEINDLTRQLAKKMDIFNYYFSFLKLIGVWNKVRRKRLLLKFYIVIYK